jgi:hypothetical protein
MIRTLFAVVMMFSLAGVIEAQEVNPPLAPKPIPQAAPHGPSGRGVDEVTYFIEFRVLERDLEGKVLFSDDGAFRDLTALSSAAELLRKSAHQSLEKTTTDGAAPHPAPAPATPRIGDQAVSNAAPVPPSAQPPAAVVPSPIAAHQPATAGNSPEDELWESSAMDSLGITTVAAPRMVIFAKQSATCLIQTSTPLSYLVPLGDGKYQVKYTVQALGMKITVAVQRADGDDTSVELSPLEIAITALDGREPVEGLDLDVGKPIISTRSLKTTTKVKLGATRLIAIPSGPRTQAALLLRVKRGSSDFAAPPPHQLNEPQSK